VCFTSDRKIIKFADEYLPLMTKAARPTYPPGGPLNVPSYMPANSASSPPLLALPAPEPSPMTPLNVGQRRPPPPPEEDDEDETYTFHRTQNGRPYIFSAGQKRSK
jgi:hypothetical protein